MRLSRLGLFTVVALHGVSIADAEPVAHQLVPQDSIELRVVAWTSDTGAYEAVDALGGRFSVGADGRVMLPVVGPVTAAGLTIRQLSEEVAAALQESVRFIERPSVSAEIVSYRPVYVLGDVEHPGAVPYQPGMTVMQALALAGGLSGPPRERLGAERDGLRASGTLRESRIDLATLRAREVRLIAERDGLPEVLFPPTLTHPDGPDALAPILAQERTIFRARRDALQRELAALEDLQTLLQTEIVALERKGEGHAVQLERVRQAVGDLEGLLKQGLARAPAVLAQQRALLDLEGRELDIETAIFRARQSLGETEREAVELRARREVEAASRLQETQASIARLKERAKTAAALVVEAGGAAALRDAGELSYRFVIQRANEAEDIAAGRRTTLWGGDVLDVTAVIEDTVETQ